MGRRQGPTSDFGEIGGGPRSFTLVRFSEIPKADEAAVQVRKITHLNKKPRSQRNNSHIGTASKVALLIPRHSPRVDALLGSEVLKAWNKANIWAPLARPVAPAYQPDDDG